MKTSVKSFLDKLIEEMYRVAGITPEELDAPPKTATGIQYYISSRVKNSYVDPITAFHFDDGAYDKPKSQKIRRWNSEKQMWEDEDVEDERKPGECLPWNHSWRRYTGVREVYDFCEVCDVKRKADG